MTRSGQLPQQLLSTPFTRGEAHALGVSDKRLRNSDIIRPTHGVFASIDGPLDWPEG